MWRESRLRMPGGSGCESTSMALVTRNTKDFQDLDIELIHPW